VLMISRRLYTAYAWLTFLAQEDAAAQQLRPRWSEQGRFPARRTWERRLAAWPQHWPGLSGCVGPHLVVGLRPWAHHGRAAAVDSTPLNTRGGVWHQKHTAQGEIPPTSIAPEAGWSTSGWHGWWYGWKRPLAVSVGAVGIPLAAELPPAKTADHTVAPHVLAPLPAEVRDVLGDTP
jgi:hypothetical protein